MDAPLKGKCHGCHMPRILTIVSWKSGKEVTTEALCNNCASSLVKHLNEYTDIKPKFLTHPNLTKWEKMKTWMKKPYNKMKQLFSNLRKTT